MGVHWRLGGGQIYTQYRIFILGADTSDCCQSHIFRILQAFQCMMVTENYFESWLSTSDLFVNR